jgi:hypothetical protein
MGSKCGQGGRARSERGKLRQRILKRRGTEDTGVGRFVDRLVNRTSLDLSARERAAHTSDGVDHTPMA